jgi:SAM-dependent methyltransferase
MREAEQWQPSKFVFRGGTLRASSDSDEVAITARLIADLTARWYGSVIPDHVRGRVLDLGCGNVPFYEAYRDLADSVTCVDWEGSLHGRRHIDLYCDLTQPLPFAGDSFETIILSDVLEHLPEPEKCWLEMNRLLTPGGKVLLNVPFSYRLHEEPHDFYRYTRFALERFAHQSGFEVVRLEPVGGLVECFVSLMSEVLISARLPLLAKAAQRACTPFSRSKRGAALALKTGEWQPLGYGMVVNKAELNTTPGLA